MKSVSDPSESKAKAHVLYIYMHMQVYATAPWGILYFILKLYAHPLPH